MSYQRHEYKRFFCASLACPSLPVAFAGDVPAPLAGLRVPAAIAGLSQFLVWRLEPKPGETKPRKMPYNPVTGQLASTTDPTTWGTLEQAQHAINSGQYQGIGFVFTASDPFVFLDFDDCKDDDGEWLNGDSQWNLFANSAWEYSQSGNGLHVIVTVQDKSFLAHHANKWWRPDGGQNECYNTGRFVAFGPHGWQGEPQPADDLMHLFVPPRTAPSAQHLDWSDQPQPGYDGPEDDDTLIQRAVDSTGGAGSMFGTAAPFRALWNADGAALGRFWPDDGGQGRAFDHSSAVMALMNALAWWTGCNHARMWRLFQRSALYRPEKERTALRALNKAAAEKATAGSYLKTREQRMKDAAAIGEDVGDITTPVMSLNEACEKLVFIRIGDGAVVHRDRKMAAKWNGAKKDYAASEHTFETGEIDGHGEPKTKTVKVIDAWLNIPGKLTVDELTWQPGEREFCKSLDGLGNAYNTYVPMKLLPPPQNWQEWVKPFLDHVAYLVPIERERIRFLQWLAHIIQKPHELPHTCYLLTTPTQGTGRGTLAEILARVFRGYAALGLSPDTIVGDGFNGRLSKKLFATIDEIREGSRSPHSREAQTFKDRVTGTDNHINPKYGIQSVEKNCIRWLFFSNYEDAIPFDNSDRRVIVIANPTTKASPEWFDHLRACMEHPEFFASIQHYLATLDLAGFKAGADAPMNDAKRKVLAAMEKPELRAAKQFKDEWPGPLAAVSDLRAFVGDDDWPKHSGSVSKLITAAGMIPTGRKVKVSNVMETILIVQPDQIPPDAFPMMMPHEISKMVTAARTAPSA